MEQTKHIQSILLMMMKDLDSFCRQNNIKYYLNGGNALGAMRHQGFIPWDDDADIMLSYPDYVMLLAKLKADKYIQEKYYIEEARKDWPSYFSKIRLRGTRVVDKEAWNGTPEEGLGLWIDIFPMSYASSKKICRRIQYFCAKMLVAYSLSVRGYATAPFKKQVIMGCSRILSLPFLRKSFEKVVFHHKKSNTLATLMGNTRFSSSFLPFEVYGDSKYVQYDGLMLPVPDDCDKYLSTVFGDYMKLPPKEKQVAATHIVEIDFGKY